MRVAVIGAGSWGTTVAALAASRSPTTLWARRPELAERIDSTHENPEYLPGLPLPRRLRATCHLPEAVEGAEVLVMAVPSHGFRRVFRQLAPLLPTHVPVLSLVKGIEEGTMRRMSEVVAEEAPARDPARTGVLTGPNLAGEVAAGQPAASVIAMGDPATARALQERFMSPTLRIYTNDDLVGCELAGALKNVMAIAAGMSRGLGFGHNSLAALVTRALAEITRLGVSLGGRPRTFAGLAGMGDLIATCQSEQSRNNRVGFGLARGRRLEDVVAEMRMVAEGVKTVGPVLALAERCGVDMPIATEVARVLHEGAHPRDAVLTLMSREPKQEL